MPIPEHERVPKKTPGRKPGQKSSSLEVLQRTVQVWKMIFNRGWGLTEIYTWNMDPARALHPETGEPIPNQWGYSFTQVSQLVQKARKMGAAHICKSHEEAVRRTLASLTDLKERAGLGGDFRVEYICTMQIAKIQDTYLGKASKFKADPVTGVPSAASFQWLEESKAIAAQAPPIGPVSTPFEDVTDQHVPPPSE